MRRQNQRMSRKDDQPSAARAVAFLHSKHGEALPKETSACSDGFALIFVENTSKNAFFLTGGLRRWRWLFWLLFCHQKSNKNKFFRRKPSKKFLPNLTLQLFCTKFKPQA